MRGIAALDTLPAEHKSALAYRLIVNLLRLGRCGAAESLSQAHQLGVVGLVWPLKPAALRADRSCADRLITRFAEAVTQGETAPDPWRVYTAGRLWRVIGEHDKAEAATDAADRHYFAEEESDPIDAWSCHGGNCVSRLWNVRLSTLTRLRDTPYYRAELRWLATQALSYANARDARRRAPQVSQALMAQLLYLAVNAGEDRLAQLLAERTVEGYPAAYAGARMSLLIAQDKIEEALELWPTAGRAFGATITPELFRAHLPLFHRWREQLKHRHFRQPGEWLSLLAAIWIERGDHTRAREALATARAVHAEVRGFEWDLEHVQRLVAVEAMLDGGADPVGWLRRHSFPSSRSLERDYAFGDLAALLAATGRQAETRRALAEIHAPRVRLARLIELPCRAAYGGDAAAAFAVGLTRGNLRPRDRADQDEVATSAGRVWQTFSCLVRAGRGPAALSYAQAVEDPAGRLSLFVSMPRSSSAADDNVLRRRFAVLAYALIDARNLWERNEVAYLAAEFERVGDFAAVDRVLARARGEVVVDAYDKLLGVYASP